MSRYNVSILSAVVGIVFTTTGYTAVINVPDDIGTIQGGIDAAEDGDTVLVAPGEYRESINFLGKNIIVGSRYMTTGDWQFVAETVIRPQARGRVVTFANGETEEAEIVGFTLTGGRADTDGGIFCESANPCINACLITRNSGNGIRCSIAGPSISNCTISENNSAGGAGIDIQGQAANPVITDCEFLSNTAGFVGGGMHVGWGANATLTRCNFFDNTGGESEGPTGHAIGISRSSLTLINCTIGRQRIQADWIRNAISINRATINLINCILWREQGDDMISTWDENPNSQINISYTNMEGGRGSIHYVDDHINWGEGNIDENPCFVDAGNGDHRLTEASPCIDAGDPNLPPDPDGTRADMGALYFSQFFAILAGRVFDAVTDEPFINLRIPSQLGIVAVTDSLGEWWMQLPVSANGTQMELRLGARGYVPVVVDTTAFPNDSLWFDIGLDPINLLLNPEEISLVVDSGEMATVEIMLTNPEAIDLEWSAVTYTSGGAGVSLGTLRQTIAAGEITGDNRIQGVAFDGRYFYAAGNGLPGDPTNMVYVIDLEGNFVGSFPQPTSSQYGFKDLEWDGELIWGSGEETVFAINTEGNVVRRWRGPYSLNANIAFDPTIETLWISGTTTDVVAYDRNGNNLGVRLNNRDLRLYGLEWVGSDPDSLPLYLIDVSYESGMTVKKISSDPQIHRIETVFQFQDGAATGRSGLFICQNFDQYGCQVLMDVANISEANGNDMLEIWQIRPNHEWLTISPDHGELVASQQVVLSLELRTMGLNNNWTFASGVYEGEIVFEVPQNGVIAIVPVHLEVVGPNSYEESEHSLLTSFRLEEPFPNPFNSLTTIRFSGSINRKATLRVFDLSGRLVTDLTSQLALVRNEESKQSLVWIAEGLPGGIYLIRLQSEKESRTIKAVLMK